MLLSGESLALQLLSHIQFLYQFTCYAGILLPLLLTASLCMEALTYREGKNRHELKTFCYIWWSKGKGISQAFCFPQLIGNVVFYMISLEPSLHSSFLKAAAVVILLGGEAVTHTVGSAPRYIPVVAQESLVGHTCIAFPRNCTSQHRQD